MNNREKWLDIMKCIAILMVVNVHFPNNTSLFKHITFHLTSFFVVSGILIRRKNETNYSFREVLKKKLKSIMWPYFTLSMSYIIIQFILSKTVPINEIYYSITFLGIGTLWFFPTLFFAEVIFINIIKKIRKQQYICILVSICLTLFIFLGWVLTKNNITGKMYLDRNMLFYSTIFNYFIIILQSLIAACYIGLGYCFEMFNEKYNILKKTNIVYGIILILISLPFAIRTNANLRFVTINTPTNYLISTILSTLGIIFISFGIRKIKFLSDFLSWLGKNSIIIMTTHLEYKIVFLSYYFINNFHMSNRYMISILMFLIIIIIEMLLIKIINETKLKYLYRFPTFKNIHPVMRN